MPVYLFTFHTYRSWMPDHRRGYVKRDRGILPPDPAMASAYARRARFDRLVLDIPSRQVALDALQRICNQPARTTWQLHQAVAVFNHIHALVSWRDATDSLRVRAVLHRAITVDVRDALGLPQGRPVLARGGSRKPVRTRDHFDRLSLRYLPSHRKYDGVLLHEP